MKLTRLASARKSSGIQRAKLPGSTSQGATAPTRPLRRWPRPARPGAALCKSANRILPGARNHSPARLPPASCEVRTAANGMPPVQGGDSGDVAPHMLFLGVIQACAGGKRRSRRSATRSSVSFQRRPARHPMIGSKRLGRQSPLSPIKIRIWAGSEPTIEARLNWLFLSF